MARNDEAAAAKRSSASRARRAPSRSAAKRGPGRPADSNSADTKATILDAALHEFAEHGYSGASTRTIAGRAGVTIATVYHHFESKQMLYSAAYAYGIDRAWIAYGRAVEGKASLLDELEAMFETSLTIMKREPEISRLALHGQTVPAHVGVDPNEPPPAARDVIDAIVERAVERGELARRDTPTFRVLLSAMHWGLSVVGLNDEANRRHCIEGYRRLLEHSLLQSQPE